MSTNRDESIADAAATPAWPSMRGNRRNSGARLFDWDGVPRQIRSLDTTSLTGLSLINATPVVGPDETIYVGSSNRYFFAFPANSQHVANRVGNIVDSAACFVNPSTLYFPCGDFSLYSVAPLPNGVPQAHPLTNTVESVSTIDWFEGNVVTDASNRLYAGCDNFYLFSCNSSGTPFFRWGFPTGFFIWSACAFSADGRTAYFASADMTCYALDIETAQPDQRQRWSADLDNLCASSPAITADGRVIVGAFDGKLYGIDGTSGQRLWAIDTGSLIYASPALDPGRRAFVMSSDGVIRAFDVGAATPRVLWEFFTGMPSFCSPSIGPDPAGEAPYLVYVASGDGSVFALTPDGRRRWSYDTAALSPEWNTSQLDPAFWVSLRYPAINSSIALGNQGVVTATSGGVILSIPYDAYRRESKGFTTTPDDDYFGQLSAGGTRLCYVAPSGRMAGAIVSRGTPLSILPVSPQQTLTLAALTRTTYAPDKARSTFAPLPNGLTVAINGRPAAWRLSADRTQLYVDPPPAAADFGLTVRDGGGSVIAIARCQVAGVTRPSSPASVLARQHLVEQMSIAAPFVVPALDQLGLATITIPLRFLSIDNGVAVAYAYESYSAGSAGAPTRNLVYVFTGTYANGAFRLQSAPSDFELTGAPVPIDQLTLSGLLSEDAKETRGVSLTVSYKLTLESLVAWFLTYLSHWIPGFSSAAERSLDAIRQRAAAAPDPWLPVVRFLTRLGFAGDLMAPWKMFDDKDEMFWVGTYSLSSHAAPSGPPPAASYSYDGWLQQLTVTVTLAQPFNADNPPVVGILLFHDTTADKLPLMVDYVELNGNPTYGADRRTITQTLSMPAGTVAGLRAKVMVNLEMAAPTYVIPSS
jgi:outer membrane protein assembly factor BamB